MNRKKKSSSSEWILRNFYIPRPIDKVVYIPLDNMSPNLMILTWKMYNDYIQLTKFINKELGKYPRFRSGNIKSIRNTNFPSDVSENIVKFVIAEKYKIMPSWNTKCGDLEVGSRKVEVKSFVRGPTSFGPKEKWDFLYFVDSTRSGDGQFKVYEIGISSDSYVWKNIKINKNGETYGQQSSQGRRPRIEFEKLLPQVKKYTRELWSGSIHELRQFQQFFNN